MPPTAEESAGTLFLAPDLSENPFSAPCKSEAGNANVRAEMIVLREYPSFLIH